MRPRSVSGALSGAPSTPVPPGGPSSASASEVPPPPNLLLTLWIGRAPGD